MEENQFWRILTSSPQTEESERIEIEPVLEKTNNMGSDQVGHKPACTVTEAG